MNQDLINRIKDEIFDETYYRISNYFWYLCKSSFFFLFFFWDFNNCLFLLLLFLLIIIFRNKLVFQEIIFNIFCILNFICCWFLILITLFLIIFFTTFTTTKLNFFETVFNRPEFHFGLSLGACIFLKVSCVIYCWLIL